MLISFFKFNFQSSRTSENGGPIDAPSNESRGRSKGLSVLATAVFIAGEMAGSGVVALPKAVVDSSKFHFLTYLMDLW